MNYLLSISICLFGLTFDANKALTELTENTLNNQVENGFAGSAIVSYKAEVILSEAYGFTQPNSGTIPISPNTLFNIASITKTFTAVGVMNLVEEGKIKTSSTLAEIFPDVPEDKSSISIHQLLTHSSGFGQAYINDGVETREKALKRMMRHSLSGDPGSSFRYSNINYQMLTAIIEEKSGMDYENFIRENVFEPSGMRKSCFWSELNHKDDRLVAQKLDPFRGNKQDRNWDYLGSGGAFSCSSELYSFYQAFWSGELLQSSTKQLMLKPYVEIRPGLSMGYGWFISENNEGRKEIWTRGNESFGHNGVLRIFPETELVVIVQSNTGEKGSPTLTDNRIVSDDLVEKIFGYLKDLE